MYSGRYVLCTSNSPEIAKEMYRKHFQQKKFQHFINYIQLTRTRSGHRLERDLETGGLTTRHNLRIKQTLQTADELSRSKSNITPITSEVVTPTTPNGNESHNSVTEN